MEPCLNSLIGANETCQVPHLPREDGNTLIVVPCMPGKLARAERTGEVLAVSGIYGEGPGKGKNFPGIPWTNLIPPGSWSEPRGDLFSVILDLRAKRSEYDYYGLEKVCPSGVIKGHCANGHRFAKEVYCGREWCEVCNSKWEKGQAMKPSHGRRFSRWYPKAQQLESMGYWTFTIPMELRAKYRSKKGLTELGHQVQELLKDFGFKRGLRRWHFMGEQGWVYNPHLNCLVDGRFMNRRELRILRRAYSKLLGVKLAIAEYHYFDSPGRKVHALKYITRATFLDWRWDVDMARELRGFRNNVWWGSKLWTGEPVWSLDDLPGEQQSDMSDSQAKIVASLESGTCPYDGLPIEWERFQPISALSELGTGSLGAGYHELPRASPPRYRPDFTHLEQLRVSPGELKRTLGGSFLPAEIADSQLAERLAQHRRWIEFWLWKERGIFPGEILQSGENSPGPGVEILSVGLSVGVQNFNVSPPSSGGADIGYPTREGKN